MRFGAKGSLLTQEHSAYLCEGRGGDGAEHIEGIEKKCCIGVSASMCTWVRLACATQHTLSTAHARVHACTRALSVH